jgi:hypothetical protein
VAECRARLGNLFNGFPLRSAGRLNTVGDAAGSFDKASDRKLRGALDVQTAQVARYVGREETRESAVFQVDADPTVASDSRTLKGHIGAEHSYANAAVATNGTAIQEHDAGSLNTISVVVKGGIE